MNSGSGPVPDPSGSTPRGPDSDLSGQVAVITGGSGVIGRAIAARLVDARMRVLIADLAQGAAETAAADLGGPDMARGRRVDVRSTDDVAAMVAMAVESFGRLDILVSAAGITHVDPLLEVEPATWRNVFAVNVEGPLYCLQAAAKVMATQPIDPRTECRGKIVNISSQGAEFPIPTSTAYGASKRALNYLTETAAVDLRDSNISATIVYPGMVYEGMWKAVNLERSALRGEDFDERVRRDLADTPTGRFQDPKDLAATVLFVAAYRGLELSGKTIWSEAHVA